LDRITIAIEQGTLGWSAETDFALRINFAQYFAQANCRKSERAEVQHQESAAEVIWDERKLQGEYESSN